MTKKDYIRAATIARSFYDAGPGPVVQARGGAVEESFVQLFRGDNREAFDEDRFRAACKPATRQPTTAARPSSEVLLNYEGGDCTLAEFLKSNLETLSMGDVLAVAKLSVGQVHRIPVHCGFAQIVRTR